MARHGHSYRFCGELRAVILCAGQSTRMGRSKGLLMLDDVPLLAAHVAAYQRIGADVSVVLGPAAVEHLACLPTGIRVILNMNSLRTEMFESAWMGLSLGGEALLTPVDVPPVSPGTLEALLAHEGPCLPTWGGRDGHPVKLLPPHPRVRLDARLKGAARVPVTDPDCVLNLNRPAEWSRWLSTRKSRDEGPK